MLLNGEAWENKGVKKAFEFWKNEKYLYLCTRYRGSSSVGRA